MSLDLILLTSGTPLDIVRNPLVHLWPLVESSDFSDCFISSRVFDSRVIMDFS